MNNLEQIMCRNQVHIYKIVSKLFQADTRILILLNFSWETPIIRKTSARGIPFATISSILWRTLAAASCLGFFLGLCFLGEESRR